MKSILVKKSDIRPARPDGTCFYCSVPLGQEHKKECVIRTKTVTISINIILPYETVESWDKEDTEFHLNESSWCADNIITELEKYSKKHGCICGITKIKLIDELNKRKEK
jgi:hypothetical protein